jgi:gamma-glutamylcyclotransferase (GGCT)/AIG2-like uncharacterized protein YtfP
MNPHLFVYGSLISSVAHSMGERLRRESILLGPARLQGRLYQVDWYPGVVLSDDTADIVHGEAYRLIAPAASLAWLDEYEGIARGPSSVTARDEYIRTQTPVALDGGGELLVWIYLYQRDVGRLARVMSGRWSTAAGA